MGGAFRKIAWQAVTSYPCWVSSTIIKTALLTTGKVTKNKVAIYGTALLAFCLLCGLVVGKLIGMVVGVDDNVGGVGIAMLLLVAISGHLQATGRMSKPTQGGVLFWSSIYIPIVVAMAASQNVLGAVSSGLLAIVAGAVAVVVCFSLVPVISKIGQTVDITSFDETEPM